MVGYNYETGTITNCVNYSEVIAGTVEYDFASGGADYAGGITSTNKGTVEKCYNTGKVKATSNRTVSNAAGIIGGNYNIVNLCFNIGEIESNNKSIFYIGGIIAKNFTEVTNVITNCIYNNQQINGIGNLDDFEGVTRDLSLDLDKIKQYIK